jgi:short subunit dehydrogenase-like uncharacterized protein
MSEMSMRSIDLQFALHKNDEAGIKQNQLSHKPQQDEAILETQSALSTEKQRQRSEMVDKSSSTGIRDTLKEKHQKQGRDSKKHNAKPEETSVSGRPDHPYKGHHIDLSL